MNLAGLRRAPVVFLLKNNGWAISTPVSKQTAALSFATRATGYGFPGELVDGNDLFAVHDATSRAVARARAGEGPTLIEARTYRLGPHNTADDPTRYVDPAELERRRHVEPIGRLRRHLQARGLIDERSEAELTAELSKEIEAAVRAAEGGLRPGPAALFEHVYGDPPRRVRDQRARATQEPE
jgi:pyruvate dehydrogenase E1 component alpha subunit